jgi:RHS repeat-associated protein
VPGQQRVARVDRPSGTVHYYFSDGLGSARVVTDANGNLQQQSDYFPYGGEIVINAGDPNHYKFTGKERDAESGLDNFVARYDASSLGRFMTPHPLLRQWRTVEPADLEPLRLCPEQSIGDCRSNWPVRPQQHVCE